MFIFESIKKKRVKLCDYTPSAPQHINYFKPFHFTAGDKLVVPIGASHISSYLQEIQSREREKKNKRTNEQ